MYGVCLYAGCPYASTPAPPPTVEVFADSASLGETLHVAISTTQQESVSLNEVISQALAVAIFDTMLVAETSRAAIATTFQESVELNESAYRAWVVEILETISAGEISNTLPGVGFTDHVGIRETLFVFLNGVQQDIWRVIDRKPNTNWRPLPRNEQND